MGLMDNIKKAQEMAQQRYAVYQQLAGITVPLIEAAPEAPRAGGAPESEE